MSKYFLSHTQLSDLERQLMAIPGFDQQHSGARRFEYTPEMCDCSLCVQAAQKEACQLRGRCIYMEKTSPQPSPSLKEQLRAISEKPLPNPMEDAFIKARMHTLKRMGAQFLLHRHKVYTAAVFLLCSRLELWQSASYAITANTVRFDRIATDGLSEPSLLLLKAAQGIFEENSQLYEADILNPAKINDGLFLLIATAIYISHRGLPLGYWQKEEKDGKE